ncbi:MULTISPECIES: hypothetical protein [Thioclava]|uniref:Flagellar export protein FliJ n=1 Tax=Thioclava nitratireducens TaxID=1915078 RepID=A0ABM6ID00_9RHOB|nr:MULTISPECIES: hypothetical protein [Thioclava]AQS46573.1 hypothetical protein BMG03_01205 [Thioclava nitratireducens]OWY08282.1 hypothetical protein B6V74_14115 [Thioclava sp. F42-5]WGT52138.1 hypothetical protein P0N61_08975 [Thioclava nitratireducens]
MAQMSKLQVARLTKLARLTRMQSEAELAALARLNAQARALDLRIASLQAEERSSRATLALDPTFGQNTLAYLRYLSLEETRLRAARDELNPAIAKQHDATARAVGRHDVVTKLGRPKREMPR